jgi:uncharacterized protein YcbX
MIEVSGLTIYPVKSCAGIDGRSMRLDRFGLVGDRRWLLVDENNRFMSQRELSSMALIGAAVDDDGLRLDFQQQSLRVAQPSADARLRQVTVWSDTLRALDAGEEAADWLSEKLGQPCRLVYMGDDCQRYVDGVYAREGETVSFADGFPLLLISQASLDDLNARLSSPVPMNRFRPNLVVSGCEAFAEDSWRRIRVGEIEFDVAKPCSRCVMPSIDQASGRKDSEILRVLAGYRRGEDRQTYFGQNLLYRGSGEIALGAIVEVLE